MILALVGLICYEICAWCNRTRTLVFDYQEPAYGNLLALHNEEIAEMEANANAPLININKKMVNEEMVNEETVNEEMVK